MENKRKDCYVTQKFTLLVHTDHLETKQANISRQTSGNVLHTNAHIKVQTVLKEIKMALT